MLWLALTDIRSADAAALLGKFSEDSDTLGLSRASAQRRRQRAVARSLTRYLIETRVGQSRNDYCLSSDDDGAPRVTLTGAASVHLSASASHSHNLAVSVLSTLGAVGIDVEFAKRRRSHEAIAAAVYGERERSLCQQGGLDAFYRIWTLREALAKASRSGFSALLANTDHFGSPHDGRTWWQTVDDCEW